MPSVYPERREQEARRQLRAAGLEYTRANYIAWNWGDGFGPEGWTAEHEAELPPSLQNWSIFERQRAQSGS